MLSDRDVLLGTAWILASFAGCVALAVGGVLYVMTRYKRLGIVLFLIGIVPVAYYAMGLARHILGGGM